MWRNSNNNKIIQLLITIAELASLVKAHQCPKDAYSLVTGRPKGGDIHIQVCPVAQSDMTIEGSKSLSSCLAWCTKVNCPTYTFHADTTLNQMIGHCN